MQAAIRIPEPSDNDPDSVATALETAALLVAKGELAEALRWVRRGAESASENGHDIRALALARAAAELSDQLASCPPPSATRATLQGTPVVPIFNPASGAYSIARPLKHMSSADRPASAASEAPTAPPPELPLSASRNAAPSSPVAAPEPPPPSSHSSAPPAPISSYPPPSSESSRPKIATRKTARVAVRSAGGSQYVVRTLEEDEDLDHGEQEGLLVLLEPRSRLF